VALQNLDRRIIYILIFLAVSIPLIKPIGLKMHISENVKKVYSLVQETPENSRVLFSFDYDPASMPELHPMAISAFRQALLKKQKIVCTAMWPMGVQMYEDVVKKMKVEFPNIKYGVDYINLGYKAGGIVTMQAMESDINKVFPTDFSGKALSDFPIMNNVSSLKNFKYVLSFSAGAPGIKEWVMIAHDQAKIKVAGGVTAVSAPSILPYVNDQHQLVGLLGGMAAAAQFESLNHFKGTATKGMDAQSLAHLVIIIFILMGNLNYILLKKKKERGNK